VPTVKLDTFCELENLIPDVIKIDVEGAEGMVLRGALQILRRFRPVLVASLHPYWLPDLETPETLLRVLGDCGYNIRDSRITHFEGFAIGDYLLSA
jgi:hypothetical protein